MQIKLFATSGSGYLADGIWSSIGSRLPGDILIERSNHVVDTFSNENIQVTVPEVRGVYCIVIHTQVPPVHTNFFELFALLDAIYNSEAENLLVVFPYMPYSRSDRKDEPRISTMSVWVANTINEICGVKKVLLTEPHDGHIKHYFKPQAQEISTMYLLADYIRRKYLRSEEERKITKIVFPDAGAAKRYGEVAHILKLGTAYIDKDRPDNGENPDFKEIVGDVDGFICIMIDDECLTARTTIGDAENLISHGAKKIIMVVTHPIVNDKKLPEDGVIKKIEDSPISEVIFTNTIPIQHKIAGRDKFTIVPVDSLLAEAIKRIILKQSISSLHKIESIRELNL